MFGTMSPAEKRQAVLLILVAALGYFVDIFDLLLFGMLRVASLKDLGVSEEGMLTEGGRLISLQMWGMLFGGVFWGVLGDRRGRLSVLFGSILTYSVANIANAYVTTLDQYALWRFIAGVGLAGELGAGITLVTEVLPKQGRGLGTSIVAGVGILGAVVGYEVAERFNWRQAYLIGGVLGLLLLALRVGVSESGLFNKVKDSASRGDLRLLLGRPRSRLKFLAVVALGVPLWYMVGLLITFSPEFAKAAGLDLAVKAAKAIAVCYWGLAIGDLASGFISQALGSRRRAVLGYMLFLLAGIVFYFAVGLRHPAFFYPSCFLMGLGGGYWALFVTIGAEQFGTDLRATVATSVPNFVRGAVPLLVHAFLWLQAKVAAPDFLPDFVRSLLPGFLNFRGPGLGIVAAGLWVGAAVFVLSFWGWSAIEETYHKDLDYLEVGEA